MSGTATAKVARAAAAGAASAAAAGTASAAAASAGVAGAAAGTAVAGGQDGERWAGCEDQASWAEQIRRLAQQRDAVILAHNYQAPEIQDVADHVGDSLALSRLAAASTASTIVFAGVYFMAETAKILAPDRTVLIPDSRAGCSLADSITAQQVREWKAEHPGAAVVAYVNTSAEVKAESDVCCTSANATAIVAVAPGGPGDPVPARPVPRRPRAAGHRPRQHAHLARRVPRARGHQPGGVAAQGGRRGRGGAVHPPRVRVLDRGALAGGNGGPAGRPDPGAVHRGHAGRRPLHQGPGRARGHGDRHAAPVAPGQPRGALGAGQPQRRMPVHEDDHTSHVCCAACATGWRRCTSLPTSPTGPATRCSAMIAVGTPSAAGE